MQIRKLDSSQYKRTQWKNGRGSTTEFFIFPQESSVQENNFLWRASSARVEEKGPFSIFTGYHRYLAILEGQGLILQFEDRKEIIRGNVILKFLGGEKVESSLIDGPVVDFNFIVDEKLGSAKIHFGQDSQQLSMSSFFILNLSSRLFVEVQGQNFELKSNESLVADGKSTAEVILKSVNSKYLLAQIVPTTTFQSAGPDHSNSF